jgi:signal transduction histidine kinase
LNDTNRAIVSLERLNLSALSTVLCVADMPSHPSRIDDRYTRVMRKTHGITAVGAVAIAGLIALEVRHQPRALEWVALCLLVQIPVNSWITLVLLRRMGAASGEITRMCVNLALSVLQFHETAWPLAGWLWLPFVAFALDGLPVVSWSTLGVMCGVMGAVAIHDGVSWLLPLSFATLSILVRSTTEMRSRVLREMFEESERQRVALDAAHAELKAAHEGLTAAVAARQRIEFELRQAHKLEAVGRLASGVAHEINSPLQVVTNSLECIADGVPELLAASRSAGGHRTEVDEAASDVASAVALASDGVKRVASIVSSLKEFARPDQNEIVNVDLNRAVETTLAMAKHEYRYVADAQVDLGEIPEVLCNPGEINQVLLGLVVNAAHAIAEVVGTSGEKGLIVIRTRHDGGDVVVAISDTGCGIPQGMTNKIFEPFFTTKEVGHGRGQGLAIARATVDKYGGRLTFESTVGVGSTFSMRLPAGGTASKDGRQAA